MDMRVEQGDGNAPAGGPRFSAPEVAPAASAFPDVPFHRLAVYLVCGRVPLSGALDALATHHRERA